MRLDHVSYACESSQLAEVVQRIGSDLGAPFVDGGIHPSFGTRNFILPLADGTYVEVVAALDHPAADKAPFGRAVRQRAEEGGGWLGWVVAVDDIAGIEQRLGRDSVAGHRIRPDGSDLRWKQIGVLDLLEDPQLPYFIQWEQRAEHPSSPGGDVRLASIEMCGDAETLAEWLPVGQDLGVELTWVEAEDRGISACNFLTPRGFVRID
ncbi:MAG: VOC family protein [Candidatus Nanopelagicales bacterium]